MGSRRDRERDLPDSRLSWRTARKKRIGKTGELPGTGTLRSRQHA